MARERAEVPPRLMSAAELESIRAAERARGARAVRQLIIREAGTDWNRAVAILGTIRRAIIASGATTVRVSEGSDAES